MPNYRAPGVYVEEISAFPQSIEQVETAVPAFIGATERRSYKKEDLTNRAVRLTSLQEYEERYGTAQPETGLVVTIHETRTPEGKVTAQEVSANFKSGEAPSPNIMYYALQAYFANGGGPCYVVSVGEFEEPTLAALQKGLAAIAKEDEPTLLVFPEAQSLDPPDHFTLINDALTQCGKLRDRFLIADLHVSGEGLTSNADLNDAISTFRNGVTSDHLEYGAAYFPNLRTTFSYRYQDDAVEVSHSLNGVPGDGDLNGKSLKALAGSHEGVFRQAKATLAALPMTLPPSAAIAGIYARVDKNRGVWKAPANESLKSVSGLTLQLNDDTQENLNVDPTTGKSINAIRAFTGRGVLVWGARTLAGNSNDWRYVSIRRFFNMVEESIKNATARFVFEPNDANTWSNVQAVVSQFLEQQWRAGALQGRTSREAFFIEVGLGKTMTPIDIQEGRLIVEVGMAVVRPAEFIILQFRHKMLGP